MENIINQKIGQLLVLKEAGSGKYGKKYVCKCSCGNETILYRAQLTRKKRPTLSCGCLRQEAGHKNGVDISNQRFGKLIAIKKVAIDANRRYIWLCKCDCGNTKEVNSNHLRRKIDPVISCGLCVNHYNGIKYSNVQKNLQNMIKHSIMNFKIGKYYVDLALIEDKIFIEYDSWYWHSHKIEFDKYRIKQIKKQGWKGLIIKGNRSLPTQKQINSSIQKLKTTNKTHIVVKLKDWGSGSTRIGY